MTLSPCFPQSHSSALGIGVPWTLYVLALHTVWSISVPIALVESGTRRGAQPWLRLRGLIVTGLLLVIGIAAITVVSWAGDHFWASPGQLIAVVVVAGLLIVVAFLVPRRVPVARASGCPAWLLLLVTLGGGTLFMVGMRLSTVAAVVAMLVAFVAVLWVLVVWVRTQAQVLAAAAGGVLVYAGHSFFLEPLQGGGAVITPVSKVVFAGAGLVLLVVLYRRRAWESGVVVGSAGGVLDSVLPAGSVASAGDARVTGESLGEGPGPVGGPRSAEGPRPD